MLFLALNQQCQSTEGTLYVVYVTYCIVIGDQVMMVTCTENFAEFVHAVFEICQRMDSQTLYTQTGRHTDMPITILYILPGKDVK